MIYNDLIRKKKFTNKNKLMILETQGSNNSNREGREREGKKKKDFGSFI